MTETVQPTKHMYIGGRLLTKDQAQQVHQVAWDAFKCLRALDWDRDKALSRAEGWYKLVGATITDEEYDQ